MARQFSGFNTDYLVSASPLNPLGATQLAISLWFTVTNNLSTGPQGGLLDWGGSGNGRVIIYQQPTHGGRMEYYYQGNFGQSIAYDDSGFSPYSTSTWHHMLMNIDINLASQELHGIYVDGTLSSLNYSANNNNVTTFQIRNLYIGNQATLDSPHNGALAELAMWVGEDFGATEATSLYNGGLGIDARDLSTGATMILYNQLCGNDSPEVSITGPNLLVAGSPPQATHPISGSTICQVAGDSILTHPLYAIIRT